MKILRAKIGGILCYTSDEKLGKVYVASSRYLEYLKALQVVNSFETEVDAQYDKS